MKKMLPWLFVAASIALGIFAVNRPMAEDADHTTPEDAIAAYVDGVARQDLNAVVAASGADSKSKGLNFIAIVDEFRELSAYTPAPASDPFFIELNRVAFEAEILFRVKLLTYGLMTNKDVTDGTGVLMDAKGAAEFVTVVHPDRLENLSLVKIGVPRPSLQNNENFQARTVKHARLFGADRSTERVALLQFEGLHFMIGFSLFRYGDKWVIDSQTSSLANLSSTGIPRRVTPEEFEKILSQDE